MRTIMIEKRKELGLTQAQIAEIIGVSRNTYTSYETGAITPSLDVAIKIKKALKTKDDNIFLVKNDTMSDNNIA